MIALLALAFVLASLAVSLATVRVYARHLASERRSALQTALALAD